MKKVWYMAAGLFWLCSTGVRADEAPEDVAALMQYLEHHLREANRALIWDDPGDLQAAALAIAEHPMLAMGERVRVLSQLGAEASAFRAHDARMQEAAQALADAALEDDRHAIGKAHWALLESCAACHRDFGHRLAGKGGSP